ncbi:uncharacterized protein K452DRAFT_346886 [Aplosporella prunicola CBS 121167]|uniref:Uncharacterized protein n=1 Tax=Aplosporella prunicola CBS 121167 TaxID=1176127 RepID=A0A6A6BIJ8_9PEZI|nr:uncharacterized protein K452DRAFT_346886 [Aplosporella prunicola CBS 121167]KAF2143145.1 hypothetical protein K452DRAFT_346886 [Aplosporella prunicola CBS 121167]
MAPTPQSPPNFEAMASFYSQVVEHFNGLAAQQSRLKEHRPDQEDRSELTTLLVEICDKIDGLNKRMDMTVTRMNKMERVMRDIHQDIKNSRNNLRKDITDIKEDLCDQMSSESKALSGNMDKGFVKLREDTQAVHAEVMDQHTMLNSFPVHPSVAPTMNNREAQKNSDNVGSSMIFGGSPTKRENNSTFGAEDMKKSSPFGGLGCSNGNAFGTFGRRLSK